MKTRVSAVPMYDDLSSDYDRFVNWGERLAFELPFIEDCLKPLARQPGQIRVLDAACGTGMHAIELSRRGYQLAGADLSGTMIDQARENVRKAGTEVTFKTAGFGGLAEAFGTHSSGGAFDAVLCLGNSLPHLLDTNGVIQALADFAACLRPGGVLLVQNRNFDAVTAGKQRWMEPQSFRDGNREWLFVRFYDFLTDGLIQFNIVTLKRQENEAWHQASTSTRLRPLFQKDLDAALQTAGFGRMFYFGGLTQGGFNPETSGNLVVKAVRL